MTVWFTSDQHFGHRNIIDFCSRPFESVEAMDEALIAGWNSVVGVDDEVWHLGDFAYRCGPNRMAEVFHRLRGRALHLVRGNHDRKRTLALPWASIQTLAEIVVGGRRLVLSHYAFRVWNGCNRGSWHLFGHSHGGLPGTSTSCDVGVDAWDFRPVAIDQIAARLSGSEEGS